jgi:hypothetical protein
MGTKAIIALGALLAGYSLGKTARQKGLLAAAGSLAATALAGYAMYQVTVPVAQSLIHQTLGE